MATTAMKEKVDQIGENTKKNCFSTRSITHIIYNESVDIMKRDESNIFGGYFYQLRRVT